MTFVVPKISIIIPIYNASNYLRQCLDSVLNQSLKELEIICVDDGSNDNTCAIVEEYMKNDKRFILYKQNHAGAGAARNLALIKSKGEYIAFLDGDDFYFESFALEKMYNEAKINNANVCASYRKKLYNDKIENEDFLLNFQCKDKSSQWIDFQDHQNDWHFHSYLYSREFLIENNLSFPNYFRYQDPPFLLKTLILAKRFLLIPVFLYCYRSGYRNLHLDELQTYHTLLGIYDNLLLAQKNNYDKLFELLLTRIDTIYYDNIASHLSLHIIEILIKIDNLSKQFLSKDSSLLLISNLIDGMKKLKYEEYLFPFEYVINDKKILLYGAGLVGQALYYQFHTYGKRSSKIIGVIDRNKQAFINEDITIFNVEEITDLGFDIIILATEFEYVAKDMKNILYQYKIPDNKIFWDRNGYRKKNIYSNL